jgi:hypothetical protein
MKKILIYISFLFISSGALAQAKIGVDGNVIATGNYPVVNSEHVKGGLHDDIQTIILRNAILPAFRKVGMLVYVVDSSKYYYLKTGITNSDWSELTLGSSGTISPTNQIQNGIISGGTVTWSGTGLTFDITALIYAKNGIIYTIPAGQVTLDPSDNTYGRIDLILADTVVNSFLKKTGIAGTVPITPQATPDSQVALTTGILLNAGSVTPPNISTTMVYDENNAPPEWVVGGGTYLVYDKNNTEMPFSGLKAIKITSYSPTYFTSLIFSSSDQDATLDKVIKFRIKLTGALNSTNTMRIFIYENSTLVSSTDRFQNGYGFSQTNTTTYQNVSIPLSYLSSFTGTKFNKIYIEFNGSLSAPFYVDRVEIQDGVPNITPQTDYSNKIDSVTLVKDTLVTTWIKGVGTTKYVISGIKYQYTSADSLYHINVYQDGHHDSTIYVGSGVGSGGYYPSDSTVIKVQGPYLSYDLTDSLLKFHPDSLKTISSYGKNVNGDSTILTLSNGTRFAAKDSISGQSFSNGLVSTGIMSLTDSTLTINAPIVWKYKGITYTKNTASTFIINTASSGYYRKDLIYADSTGVLTKVVGGQDTTITVPPSFPSYGIQVTIVDIFGSTITKPVPTPSSNFWSLNGNSLYNDSSKFGTTNNKPLKIVTNNTTRLIIDEIGNATFNTDLRFKFSILAEGDQNNTGVVFSTPGSATSIISFNNGLFNIKEQYGTEITTGTYRPLSIIAYDTILLKANNFDALQNSITFADANGVLGQFKPDHKLYLSNGLYIANPSTTKVTFGGYGSGTKTGTATYNLGVDASGNIIEVAGGGGGASRFGIEDNTGVQNREVTLGTGNSLKVDLDSSGFYWMKLGQNGNIGSNKSFEILMQNPKTNTFTDYQQDTSGIFVFYNNNNVGQDINLYKTKLSLSSREQVNNFGNGERRYLNLTPHSVGIVRAGIGYDNTEREIVTSVNGFFADSTGNIRLKLKSYTVATLPATPTQGDEAAVTDATAPTYLGALTGGGSVYTPVVFNGTIWISH